MIYKLKKPITISVIREYLIDNEEIYFRDGGTEITHLGFPDNPSRDYIISFASSHERFVKLMQNCTQGSLVFVTKEIFLANKRNAIKKFDCIVCSNPRNTFAIIIDSICNTETAMDIQTKEIKESSRDFNGNIGFNSVLSKFVSLANNVVIGANCTIGFSGFGFYIDRKGQKKRFPHFGRVIIKNNVEIDANVVIDRGVFDDTVIQENVKIGALTHIAHNVQVGKNVVVAPHSKLCGSVKIGQDSYIAPGAIIRQTKVVGKKSIVGLGSVVTRDFPPRSLIYGIPGKKVGLVQLNQELPI